jgi:oxygen-dependent protoporphyrinogen oxidase
VPHIGIIGGGIAGLCVAFHRLARGDRVTLFEAAPQLGGQLQTERSCGFLIEHGAEGFVAGSTAMTELARVLGLSGDLLDQSVTDSCRFDGQRLVRLEPGEAGRLLGFQVAPRALGKGIQSFTLGMSQVVNALGQKIAPVARVSCGSAVETLRPAAAGGWAISGRQNDERVDRVVVATGAAAAAGVLGDVFGAPALALASSAALDSVTVSLVYARADVAHPLDATGFVVSEEATLEGFRACTFASSKLLGRAPADRALLRLFFRPSAEELRELTDTAWTERAERCVRRALEIRAPAGRSWVSRWARALPVFDTDHRARVSALEAQLAGSGVCLAGAAFHGAGIDGAVRSAEAAAQNLDLEPSQGDSRPPTTKDRATKRG